MSKQFISYVCIVETLGAASVLQSETNKTIEREKGFGWSVRSAEMTTAVLPETDHDTYAVAKYMTIVFEQEVPHV